MMQFRLCMLLWLNMLIKVQYFLTTKHIIKEYLLRGYLFPN